MAGYLPFPSPGRKTFARMTAPSDIVIAWLHRFTCAPAPAGSPNVAKSPTAPASAVRRINTSQPLARVTPAFRLTGEVHAWSASSVDHAPYDRFARASRT